MIARNDDHHQERLDALGRLESLFLRATQPEQWRRMFTEEVLAQARGLAAAHDASSPQYIKALVDLYRATSKVATPGVPREYFFWRLAAHLHVEAHVGPEALLHQKDHLGPLWERRDAIWRKYGWPEEDDNGDPWAPEEHVDPLPEDYVAWSAELERVADGMERATLRLVCEKHGVPEIAVLKETDPAEFERRCKVGYAFHERAPGQDEDHPPGD